mmetsp:Transcript_73343/g.203527  ORF Transcript_73343/g.203527 Transcript_73343/m.203527 type:complete len:236 (-) Transcript_73343:1167-1874(-)
MLPFETSQPSVSWLSFKGQFRPGLRRQAWSRSARSSSVQPEWPRTGNTTVLISSRPSKPSAEMSLASRGQVVRAPADERLSNAVHQDRARRWSPAWAHCCMSSRRLARTSSLLPVHTANKKSPSSRETWAMVPAGACALLEDESCCADGGCCASSLLSRLPLSGATTGTQLCRPWLKERILPPERRTSGSKDLCRMPSTSTSLGWHTFRSVVLTTQDAWQMSQTSTDPSRVRAAM